jgi:hypothetical protein
MVITEGKDVAAPVDPSGVTFVLQNADGAQGVRQQGRCGPLDVGRSA